VLYQAMFVLPTDVKFASAETPAPLHACFGEFVSALSPEIGQRELHAEVVWSSVHGVAVLSASERIPPAVMDERLELIAAGLGATPQTPTGSWPRRPSQGFAEWVTAVAQLRAEMRSSRRVIGSLHSSVGYRTPTKPRIAWQERMSTASLDRVIRCRSRAPCPGRRSILRALASLDPGRRSRWESGVRLAGASGGSEAEHAHGA